jgi:signal peptidase I
LKENTSSEGPVQPKKSIFREYAEAILVAIVLALFIRTFVVQAFKIPSGSMKPTLLVGDHILVNKFIYGVKLPFIDRTLIPVTDPKRGDIVVFKFPEDPKKDFIKRVIGVSGDIVEVRNKKVYLNHKPMVDKHGAYLDPQVILGRARPRDNFGPVTVPAGALFVMGDNRDHSYDSRFWGFVDLSMVKGEAFIIYWSWDKETSRVRWGRIAHVLH